MTTGWGLLGSGPVDTESGLPREQDMLGLREVTGLCCLSDSEPLGTRAEAPHGALKPECHT